MSTWKPVVVICLFHPLLLYSRKPFPLWWMFASHGTHYFTFSQNIPLSLWGFPGFGWGDPHQGNARPAGGGQERVLRGLPDTDQVDLCSVLQDGVHRAGHVCEGHTARQTEGGQRCEYPHLHTDVLSTFVENQILWISLSS